MLKKIFRESHSPNKNLLIEKEATKRKKDKNKQGNKSKGSNDIYDKGRRISGHLNV
jgi:hypothetical protein